MGQILQLQKMPARANSLRNDEKNTVLDWGALTKFRATFPRVSEMVVASPCDSVFPILCDVRPILRASVWSPIFNIRVLMPETRFEFT